MLAVFGVLDFRERAMRQPAGQPERRERPRTSVGPELSRPRLVSMILGTFREMPGLSLHSNQAARLFAIPASTCTIVLADLVTAGRLRQAADGQYLARDLDGPAILAVSPQPRHASRLMQRSR